MTILVACSSTRHTLDGVHLGSMLARSFGTDLVAVTVVQPSWDQPKAARSSDDDGYADRMLAQARETTSAELSVVGADVPTSIDAQIARSTSEALVQAISRHDAQMVVLGSSTAGPLGRVAFGSVTDRLLHSSPVPVAVAPRGFSTAAGARLQRITVAYAAGLGESTLVEGAAELAYQASVPLRPATFATHQRPPASSQLGPRAEDEVVAAWTAQMTPWHDQVAESVGAMDRGPDLAEPVSGFGTSWPAALASVPWQVEEIMVVGSSRTTAAPVVFLGGTASKISRNSPVPVVILPRRSQR